jgi:hypothetical protein
VRPNSTKRRCLKPGTASNSRFFIEISAAQIIPLAACGVLWSTLMPEGKVDNDDND